MTAFFLYALDDYLPHFLTYEGANSAYALANLALYVGFRRFFGRPIPWIVLGSGFALFVATVTYFHYVQYSFAARTIAVSVFSGLICIAAATTIFSARAKWRSAYPFVLTISLAVLAGAGHLIRAAVHGALSQDLTSLLQPAPLNLLFLTLGTVFLPSMTMGAIIMVHEKMMTQAEHAGKYDFLTGILSRRAFFEAGRQELKRAARTAGETALLIFDVDHFKTINDTYGHAVGDKVLVEIAAQVEGLMRASDHFGRIGGEEFALVLPATDASHAVLAAERLRGCLDRTTQTAANDERPLVHPAYTVSIGIAVTAEPEALEELMARADKALYAAKASGRNRAILANDVSLA